MDKIPCFKEIKAVPIWEGSRNKDYLITITIDGGEPYHKLVSMLPNPPSRKVLFGRVRDGVAKMLETEVELEPEKVRLKTSRFSSKVLLNIEVPAASLNEVLSLLTPLLPGPTVAKEIDDSKSGEIWKEASAGDPVPDKPVAKASHAARMKQDEAPTAKTVSIGNLRKALTQMFLKEEALRIYPSKANSRWSSWQIARELVTAAVAVVGKAAATEAGSAEEIDGSRIIIPSERLGVFCEAVDKTLQAHVKDEERRKPMVPSIAYYLYDHLMDAKIVGKVR